MTAVHTLNSSITTGISLTATGADGSPFTITSTGAIINTATEAESYGALTGVVLSTVTNAGHVDGSRYGIYLRAGGILTNSGSVYGLTNGVKGEHITAILGIDDFDFNTASTTLINSGSIGAGGYAVQLMYGGMVNNSGTISAGFSGTGVDIRYLNPTIINSGTIIGGIAAELPMGGYLSNSSTGMLLANGPTYGTGIELGSGNATIVNAGTVLAANAGVYDRYGASLAIHNTGTIIGGLQPNNYGYDAGIWAESVSSGIIVTNNGLIESGQGASGEAITITSAALDLIVSASARFIGSITADANFANTLELTSSASTGTLTGIGSSFTGFETITIDHGATWSLSGNLAGLEAAHIEGLAGQDTIDVTNALAATDIFNSTTGLLTLFSSGTTSLGTLDLSFATIAAGETVSVHADGHGGTDITTNAICYLRGTHILTGKGEKPVEHIRIGDLVMTRFSGLQPVRWVGTQSFAQRFIRNNAAKIPVHIQPGALGHNLPARGLFVSPGHSMLLGEHLILARNLVNGINITQSFETLPDPGLIEYFQFELDAHDCLLAEGSWSESFADGPGLRAQFHNAAEYLAAHPDYVEPPYPVLCAPRPESGPALEAALRPITAQASAGLTPGPLQGCADIVTPHGISGWARDMQYPSLPVLLEIWAGATRLGTALACAPHVDPAKTGCAFHFTPLALLTPSQFASLRICRAADSLHLPRGQDNRHTQRATA